MRGGGGSPVAAVALLAALSLATPAHAQEAGTLGSQPVPVTVPSELPPTPGDLSVSAGDAINAANRTPTVRRIRSSNATVNAIPQARTGRWEIFYNADQEGVALVVVDGRTGAILEEWTEEQVAWQMARGYEGQFGHVLNAPYVWLPLAAIFLLGLFDFRRPRRIAHLDLLVLLSFGVSHAFFNAAEIGASVLLVYPPLIYLLVRMLTIGFRGPGTGLRPSAPVALLVAGLIFLIGFRAAINIADSSVIDVGYAGVIGADRITHLEPLYGPEAFPEDNRPGDTYGPANYLAYVPFELALPWSGEWDSLPSAHAASIAFDLIAIVGLFALGRRLRPGRPGRDLGVVMAFGWAAFPYTAFAMQSNVNDALIGALVIWSLVLVRSIGVRAGLIAFAGLAKFAPLILVPLMAAGRAGIAVRGGRRSPGVRLAYFAAVFATVTAALLAYPALDPGLSVAWERTFATQFDRESPFSIWGQAGWLEPLKPVAIAAVGVLAITLAFVPRGRSLLQLAALSAALLIAVQLTLAHWFYLYLPWFLGPALAALAVSWRPAPRLTRQVPARPALPPGRPEPQPASGWTP